MAVFLGRFPHNIWSARAAGGTVLEMRDEVWHIFSTQLPLEELVPTIWRIHQKFLEQQLAARAEIRFVQDPRDILLNYPNSHAAREVVWLEQNAPRSGYVFTGHAWVAAK